MGSFLPPDVLSSVARPMPMDVLLVEDNFIIALDMEEMLHELGVARVRTASCVAEALDMIVAQPPDFAFIDVNLGEEKSFAVAERLRQMGVPFAFATGYGDSYAFPTLLANAKIVSKPYVIEAIHDAIFAPSARPFPEPEVGTAG